MCLLQDFQHGKIARATRGLLTLDDIRERCHSQWHAGNLDSAGAIAESSERPHSVNGDHEIDLQAVVVADETVQVGSWVERPHDHTAESHSEGLQLLQTCRRLPKQEVEVYSRHRSALERGSRVANEHRLEFQVIEMSADLGQQRRGVHSGSIAG